MKRKSSSIESERSSSSTKKRVVQDDRKRKSSSSIENERGSSTKKRIVEDTRFEDTVLELKKLCAEDIARKTVVSRVGSFISGSTIDSRSYNMERFKCYTWVYENGFVWQLERFQREYGEIMLMTLAQTLLDNDWEILGPDICTKRKWKWICRLALAVTARRMGKSVAVARAEVALCECIIRYPLKTKKRFRQTIFSPGKRQSQGLAEYVRDHITERGLTEYRTIANEEKMEFKMDASDLDCPSVKMYFYPSNHKISTTLPPFFFCFSLSLSLSLSIGEKKIFLYFFFRIEWCIKEGKEEKR